jgi:preprotein translocase subunit SecY
MERKPSVAVDVELYLRAFRTFLVVAFSRLGNYIPIPGITEVNSLYESSFRGSSVYGLSTLSAGSNVISIFTLGLGPFFSSSLLIQFLTKFYPQFERLQNEEGDAGRKQIVTYTRLFTICFSLVESVFLSNSLRSSVFNWSSDSYIEVGVCVTVGSLILVWLSEIITERGIGNGPSILILVSNMARFPDALFNKPLDTDTIYFVYTVVTCMLMLLISNFTHDSSRKVTILSPKLLTDENYSGTNNETSRSTDASYIPIKFSQAGVVPIIFSSTILSYLTNKIENFGLLPDAGFFASLKFQELSYFSTFLILIMLFSFFYTLVILNPSDIAKNLNKMSSIIPDIQPGAATRIFLRARILESSLIGSLLLSLLIVAPFIIAKLFGVSSFAIPGITSLILTFSVINDTLDQISAYKQVGNFLSRTS